MMMMLSPVMPGMAESFDMTNMAKFSELKVILASFFILYVVHFELSFCYILDYSTLTID